MIGFTCTEFIDSTLPIVLISTGTLRTVAVASRTAVAGGAGLPAAAAVGSVFVHPASASTPAANAAFFQILICFRCLSRQTRSTSQ